MRIIASCLISFVATGFTVPTVVHADAQKYSFLIERQPLVDALNEFSKKTGVQIAYFRVHASEIKEIGPLVGFYTADEAMAQLLFGSGISFKRLNDRTITVASALPPSQRSISEQTAVHQSQGSFFRLAKVSADQEDASDGGEASLASGDDHDASPRPNRNLEEMIVTAQKRGEQRLQDVPIAISVLSGADLDRLPAQGLSEALNRVPGVTSAVSPANARIGGHFAVVIRGVPPTTGASTVAYYLDSIPFGFTRNAIAPDSSAYDLQRVEVLRGPQGTLYGLSAASGVVRVLTKDANPEKLEFKARTSASNTQDGAENYRGDVAVNIPIVEGKLAARAVYGRQELSGWIDKPNKKDVNDATMENFRLKINAQPTERLSVGVLGWLSRTDTGGWSVSPDGLRSGNLLAEPGSIDYDAVGMDLSYDFSRFSISSMTSYIDYKSNSYLDYAPLGLQNTLLNTLQESDLLSQEVLISSNEDGAPWHWSLGGLYRDVEDRFFQFRRQYLAPNDWETKSASFALFGELTRSFLDGKFEITGGVRYYENEIEDIEHSAFNSPGGIPPGGLLSVTGKFDSITPRLVANWHPDDQTTVYVSYGEGFRSGLNQSFVVLRGAPNFPSVDSDKLKSYELGYRSSLWDGRLSIDTAAFFLDWQGVQQSLTVQATPSFLTNALVNASSASGPGFEMALSAEIVDGLTLGANFSWNDLTTDAVLTSQTATGTPVVVFPKGSRLIYSPETTVGASIGYAFDIGRSGYQGVFSTSANYLPKMISAQAAAATSRVYSDSLITAKASFAVESSNDWTVSLFADNITNEDGIAGRDPFSTQWQVRIRPRTIGLQLEYEFH